MGFTWPILGSPLPAGMAVVTSGFLSPRTVGTSKGIHGAIDFAAPKGTPVYAVADGTVLEVSAAPVKYTGRYVILEHVFAGGLRLVSRSIHLDQVALIQKGQRVRAGQKIGTVGNSGSDSYSNHLHLDIRVCGAEALADYYLTFGYPSHDALPALVSIPGCDIVPAEPLVRVDGYRDSVIAQAAAAGIPLAANRTSVPAETSTGKTGGGLIVWLLVGTIVVGSAAAAWYVWRGSKRG